MLCVFQQILVGLERLAKQFGFFVFVCFFSIFFLDICILPHLGNVFLFLFFFFFLMKEAMMIPFLGFTFSFPSPISKVLKF